MPIIRILARSLALLMLLVSVSAWAVVTQEQVLLAIKNSKPNAHELLAAYAAENHKSVADVVGELVRNNPSLAGAITAAGVSANPSKAGAVTLAALQALENNPAVSPRDRPALQSAIIKNAVANSPASQVPEIRKAAATAGVPAALVDKAVKAGETSRSATASASLISSLTGLTMNTATVYAGGGVASP